MDPASLEYVEQLQQNVAELHQLGREWGMTDDEMSDCIERVLRENENVIVSPPRKSTARRIWRCIGYTPVVVSCLILGVLILFAGSSLLFVVFPSAEHYMSGKLQPYGYTIFRTIRLATLPLHRYFNITSLYDAECLVENPWYEEPTLECNWCENIKNIESLNDTKNHDLIDEFMREARPIVFKNLANVVNFEDLRGLYRQNNVVLDNAAFFRSSVPGMRSIQELFGDEVDENTLMKDGTTIHWVTRNMAGSQVIRKLFPRPTFIPPESEVALERVIFIDGHKSDHYELVVLPLQMGYYIQASGNHKVIVTPLKHCRDVCNPMQTVLKEGDILTYNPSVWKVVVMPNFQNKLSIGYAGSFSFNGLDFDLKESEDAEIQPDPDAEPQESVQEEDSKTEQT
ncbi:uncharacterized protein LOC134252697 [Saccostrea cucullata]|uniref:uncharacterized protein LOC134252697 n=1 Tax=Saccostrea cuccullata TaxID=36930 RepID=UPI002ED63AD2